jgi:membrane protease YdiL (CAAX protease family)
VAGLITVAVMLLLHQPVQWEFGVPLGALLPTAIYIFLLNALPEEYGWRGYALPRLLDRSGALTASLVLGFMWGLWHLPLHFIDGTVQSGIPIYQFALQQVVLAVFYTWPNNNTRGTVIVAILFHTVGNIVGAAVPYWTTDLGRWINFAVLLVFAVAVVLIWGPRNLSRSHEKGGQQKR